MDIFVGNLSFDAAREDLKKLFEGFGDVSSVVIVMENEKTAPKSRGFGFVQMPDEQQALAAITALNGNDFMGRALDVNVARRKVDADKVVKPGKVPHSQAAIETVQAKPAIKEDVVLGVRQARAIVRPGTYKGGRRSQSYRKQLGVPVMQQEVKPRRRRYQDNPMRWRKKKDQPKPWKKFIKDKA